MCDKKNNEFSTEAVIAEFETLTKDAAEVQRETLKKILEENRDAEYLRSLGIGNMTDEENFKKCVPLVTHKDLEPFIQRIVSGDSSPILTGKPITSVSLSSGTTQGKPKYVPFNEELVQSTMQIYRTSFAFRNRVYPINKGKALQFIYGSKQLTTTGGLTAATATTNVYRTTQFKLTLREMHSECTSPDEVIFGPDFNQSLYCHLLCGLIFSNDVQFVFSTFAHSIVHAFRTFENSFQELCNDIRTGVLSDRITVPSLRLSVSRLLSPDAALADTVYNKCVGLSDWYGLIPELWPNAKYVYGIMTGSMEPYLTKLRHYAGELPLMSADYGASEGWIGANVEPTLPPEMVSFTVLPDIGFFEFIPLKEELVGVIEPVGLTDVNVGEEYEVVITTFAGLYRYRLGDIVRIAGFYNATPKLQFLRRRSLILSVNIDKNTEKDLQISVEEASKHLILEELELVDYSSHVDTTTDPGHYVVFWEIDHDANNEVLQKCCNCLDRAFVDPGYVGQRKINAIGPLELRIVTKGTFRRILEYYLGLGAAVSQFKTPRCIDSCNGNVLQILCSNVIASYFSTAYIV